jgi:hypothetical protein
VTASSAAIATVPGETPGAVAASVDTRTSLRSNCPAWAALRCPCCGWR